MLKMTGVTLEKISDPDKYMFFEQGMRGGVSYINKRYSKANNKYCPKEWLSDYSLKIVNAHNIIAGKVKKNSAKFNEQK